MKLLRPLLVGLALTGGLYGQQKIVYQHPTTKALLDSFTIPSGMSGTVKSGGSLVVEDGATLVFADGLLAIDDVSGLQTALDARQPLDATLTAFAGITFAADTLAYGTGADTFSTTTLTSFGRSLIDDVNAAAARTTIGLGNVDNTTDAGKPVSTAQAAAIAVVQADVDAHEADTGNPHSVTKAQVGLGNADNTSDASKPVSTAQAAADAVVLASAATDATTKANAAEAAAISAAATDATTKANAAQAAAIAASQPLNEANLTPISALTTTAYGRSALELANAAAARTLFGVVIGTDVLAPNGNGSSLTDLNATAITSGTLAAARLPTTITQATTFSAAGTFFSNAAAYLQFTAPGWSGNGTAYFGPNLNAATSSAGDFFAFNIPTGKAYSFAINATSVAQIAATGLLVTGSSPRFTLSGNSGRIYMTDVDSGVSSRNWALAYSETAEGDLLLKVSAAAGGDPIAGTTALGFSRDALATFTGVGVTVQSATAPFAHIKTTADAVNPYLRLEGFNRNWYVGAVDTGSDGTFDISTDSGFATDALSFNASTLAATFGGTINAPGVITSTGGNAGLQLYDRTAGSGDAWLLSATGGSTLSFVNNGNAVLSLTKAGVASFLGNVLMDGATSAPALFISGANANASPIVYLTSNQGGGGQQRWAISSNVSGSAGELVIRDSTTGGNALTITKATLAAAFGGAVTVASGDVTVRSSTVLAGSGGNARVASVGGRVDLDPVNGRVALYGATAVDRYLDIIRADGSTIGVQLLSNGTSSMLGGLNLGGTVAVTSVAGTAEFSASRFSTSYGAIYNYRTNGVLKWYHGMRGLANENWYLYNNATSVNSIIVDAATDAVTFGGRVQANAATEHMFGPGTPTAWGSGGSINVNGATGGIVAVEYNDAAKGYIAASATTLDVATQGTNTIRLMTNGTARVTVDGSTGNVTLGNALIGTTASFTGNSTGSYPLVVRNNTLKASNGHYVGLLVGTSDAQATDLGLVYFGSATDPYWRLGAFDNGGSGWKRGVIEGALTVASSFTIATSATPASASASGITGTVNWDANYIYVATGTNTWKRVAIATW